MKASVILSSFNNLPALKLSIETLKIQTEKDFEIIISDDGSTDGTVEWLQEEKVKHFTRPNEGYRLAYIWNRGADLASGDRFIFGNSDVIWGPDFVAEHLKYADKLQLVLSKHLIHLYCQFLLFFEFPYNPFLNL